MKLSLNHSPPYTTWGSMSSILADMPAGLWVPSCVTGGQSARFAEWTEMNENEVGEYPTDAA